MDNKKLILITNSNEKIEFIANETVRSSFSFTQNEFNSNKCFYIKINYSYLSNDDTNEIYNFYKKIEYVNIQDIELYFIPEDYIENGMLEEVKIFSSKEKGLKCSKARYDEGFEPINKEVINTLLFEFENV